MQLNEQQLAEVLDNLKVISGLLVDRPGEALAVIFELMDSDDAYDAALLPPEMRLHRVSEAMDRLKISRAQLELLSHSVRSIS